MTWVIDVRYIDNNDISKSVGQSVNLTDFLLEHHEKDEFDIRVEIFKKILQDIERKKLKMEQT
jgi:hypothetical protein